MDRYADLMAARRPVLPGDRVRIIDTDEREPLHHSAAAAVPGPVSRRDSVTLTGNIAGTTDSHTDHLERLEP